MISSSALLTGCGSKDNTLPPTPLTKYTPKINIQKRWSNSVGSSSKAYVIGSTHSEKRLISASLNGRIKAINPLNGSTLWKKSTKFSFSAIHY